MPEKFNFNLKKSAIYQAVQWSRNPVFALAKPFKKIFLTLSAFLFLTFLLGLFFEVISQKGDFLTLRLAIIFFVFSLAFWLLESFFNFKLKKPKLRKTLKEALLEPEKYNLAEFLSFESARVISDLLKKRKKTKISSTSLFYFILSSSENLNFVFVRALLGEKEIKRALKNHLKTMVSEFHFSENVYENDFQDSILESFKTAEKKNHSRIEIGDLIVVLAKHEPVFKKVLIDNKLKVEDIENLVRWLEVLEEKIRERKKVWEWRNLIKKGSLAKEWAAGYTITLDKFSINLSEIVRKRGFPEIIGHKKEIEAVERVLSRSEINNVLIVGEPGIGRKSMVRAIANKSAFGEGLPQINYKRIVQLDLPRLLAQIPSTEEVEVVLDNIFKEVVVAGNVILVIDEFHSFVGESDRPGIIDISGVLAPYLSSPAFQIIAITSFVGLHKNIEQNPSLLSLFEKVEVEETSERDTLILLENFGLLLEQKHKKFISYPALRDIINYCSRYMSASPFPEKALDLLDEAMVYLAQSKDKILLPEHIARLVSQKTEIPVGEIEEKEKETLLSLESLIHERIINQEEAVKEVSTAMRRARSEVSVRSGPIGTFLFLGPTGVGKTETSKALAEIYFGSEEKMIRLDMSEFQSVTDIPRLLGGPREEGLLTTKVRERPFSLILLDEIEKAHPNILNLFLQVLDEGHLTDGLGRKVDFKNSIIIATSNAGYQIILNALREKTEWSEVKEKLLDYLFQESIYRPEFINRFDAMVVFRPLSKENLLEIADLMLKKLKKNLKEKEIELVITEPLKEKIVELSFDPTFGARQMKRVIQDKVENVLAHDLLSGKIKRGDKIEIDFQDFQLKII